MSETSPPKPMIEVSANVRRRLTSVNRAREPYDAVNSTVRSKDTRHGNGTMAADQAAHTQIIRGDDNAVFELDT